MVTTETVVKTILFVIFCYYVISWWKNRNNKKKEGFCGACGGLNTKALRGERGQIEMLVRD